MTPPEGSAGGVHAPDNVPPHGHVSSNAVGDVAVAPVALASTQLPDATLDEQVPPPASGTADGVPEHSGGALNGEDHASDDDESHHPTGLVNSIEKSNFSQLLSCHCGPGGTPLCLRCIYRALYMSERQVYVEKRDRARLAAHPLRADREPESPRTDDESSILDGLDGWPLGYYGGGHTHEVGRSVRALWSLV